MSATANEQARASDSGTPLAELAELAHAHPDLRPLIAANPSTYPDLLAWLRDLHDASIDAALDARSDAPVRAPVAEPTLLASASPARVTATTTDPIPVVVAWRRIPRLVKVVAAASLAAIVLTAIVAGSLTAAAQHRLDQAIGDHDQAQSDADSEAEAAAAPTQAPAPVENTASWNFANKAGYSFTEEITLGTPVRYDPDNPPAHEYASTTIAGTACSLSATDLVIPVKWLAQATTQSFDTSVAMAMTASPARSADYTVMVEQFFSDGAQCQTDADLSRLNVRFNNPLTTGTATWQPLFIIIKGYFAPNRPDGDPVILGQVLLRPVPSLYDAAQSTDMYVDQASGKSMAVTLAGTTVP